MQLDDKEGKFNRERLSKQNDELALNGYRVIALASGKVDNFIDKEYYDASDIPMLTFKGMVSFIDPIRVEVKDAIAKSR